MAKKKKVNKFKKVIKYVTNILCILDAVILLLNQVWGIPYADKISATIVGLVGIIGTYLTGSKIKEKIGK